MFSRMIDSARLTVLAGGLVLAWTVTIAADEATPTPTPRPAGGKSLSEVAKDKKLKGDSKGTTAGSIVITNENLSDYASQGELTTAKPGGGTNRGVHAGPGVRVVDPETAETDERKNYWQQRYRQQLEKIAAIKRQIEKLDLQIPGLWRDFYARDDPAYRDGVIKPTLDNALRSREQLDTQLRAEEPKLEEIREEARKDGAEPGWFREVKMPTPVPKTQPTPELVIETPR